MTGFFIADTDIATDEERARLPELPLELEMFHDALNAPVI